MSNDTNIPVLIVGAGPTGLMLAITLRCHGVAVRLIDRLAAPATISKALAIWSGSMEALAGIGVIDRFLAVGVRLQSLRVGDGSHRLATLVVGEGIDSPYPFPLLLPQSVTETILTDRAAAFGVAVERGVELVSLSQHEHGVSATLRHADGRQEQTEASYLVGADGARSAVRQQIDVAFEGYTEPQTFLLGDVKISGGDLDRRTITIWWNQGGTIALFPFENDVWRILGVREQDGGDAPPTLEELQNLAERHGPPGLRLHDPSWLSAFRINERLAARYRVGRVFLAGDAAHIHSPAGGQGMNTGLQDAVNLGWKLAQVVKAISPDSLLDTYEAERHPVAARVLRYTLAAVAVGRPDDRSKALNSVVAELLGLEQGRKFIGGMMSELDIAYDLGGSHPLVGRRMPDLDLTTGSGPTRVYALLHEAKPLLLDFGGSGSVDIAGWADRVRLVAAHYEGAWELPVTGIVPAPTAVLVRPDGHVAWVGDGPGAGLQDALAIWFGTPV
ncbi:MAG: FAD-dependent monooxygenase [Burkholderiales bacterium]|nr:FAD-dependent monooxygenase [Burkholderiales bacterium]